MASKIDTTVEITDDDPGRYHIPGVHNGQQTLCGWVDTSGAVDHNCIDHQCNCGSCIKAWMDIKAMKFSQYYFESK